MIFAQVDDTAIVDAIVADDVALPELGYENGQRVDGIATIRSRPTADGGARVFAVLEFDASEAMTRDGALI